MEQRADARVEQAQASVALGEWDEAFRLLREADSEQPLARSGLQALAAAAYGAGDLEASISAWERVHAGCVETGDHVAAADAAATLAMYLMMDTGLMAPVRGWVARAERLLDGQEESAVHAMLAMVRTYERFMSGDMAAADVWSRRAIEVGTRHGAAGPVAVARVAAARLLIFDGKVDEGLALLDEAAVTTLSGDLDPLTVGIVYCELICAMQGLAQYDRAQEWTEAMERWRHGNAFGGLNGRCRVHRAEMLRLRGSCADAEEEALHACEALRPWMRREFGWPLTELGTIRLRKGDLAGAEEAFLAAHEHGWDPQPGLALLRLAQGDVAAAAALIDDALDHPCLIPSKERPPSGELTRAPLLEAQVEIAVAAGALPCAAAAAAELTDIAEKFRSSALRAAAAVARARVALASDDNATVIREAEPAVAAWSEIGAPYETSVARMVLAQGHHAAGNDGRARLELQAARAALERIGAERQAGLAAAALDGHSAAAAGDAATIAPSAVAVSSANVFRCDGDTRTIRFAGEQVLLRDLKGMRYLERLLAEPGREFHAMDLVAVERGSLPTSGVAAGEPDLSVTTGGDAGPLLDEQAKQAYRRRLDEIDEDIAEARANGDLERAALAEADRDFLVRELSRAVGLGGRERAAGATTERARTSVTRAIRYALDRICEHHAALGAHLEHAVQTGTYCAYAPDPRTPISWEC